LERWEEAGDSENTESTNGWNGCAKNARLLFLQKPSRNPQQEHLPIIKNAEPNLLRISVSRSVFVIPSPACGRQGSRNPFSSLCLSLDSRFHENDRNGIWKGSRRKFISKITAW
jgi:hypothetical protein